MSLHDVLKLATSSGFDRYHLPFGVGKLKKNGQLHVFTRLGDMGISLTELEKSGHFHTALSEHVFQSANLTMFIEKGFRTWQKFRNVLQKTLDESNSANFPLSACIPLSEVHMQLPVAVGDYTDFYASKAHASKVGALFRGKENALHPNWSYIPIGYHGRASTIVADGDRVQRPAGQILLSDKNIPEFRQSQAMDYELEMGFYVGNCNPNNEYIPPSEAWNHIFGVSLLNDWSARDIQKWEYVPLGPFLGKSFATSVSCWITPIDALAPFRIPMDDQNPAPLPYLEEPQSFRFDITLEVLVNGQTTGVSNFKNVYWSLGQMLSHHTSNGCRMRAGDLLATGTISGWGEEESGCLLERNHNGQKSILIGNDERIWLQDGDTVTLRGWCRRQDHFLCLGEVTNTLHPASDF